MSHVQKLHEKTEEYIRQNEVANPFGHNVSATLIHRKIERIAVALSYIARQLNHAEPLRAELQSISTNLIRKSLALSEGFAQSGLDVTQGLVSEFRALLSCVDMLRVYGYVSDANTTLLKQACSKTIQLLKSAPASHLSDAFTLSEGFFGAEDGGLRTSQIAEVSVPGMASTQSVKKQKQAREAKESSGAPKASLPAVLTKSRVVKGSGERRSAILAVIESRGSVMIKDLVNVLPAISEKTIQRELQSMIASGLLLKEGERRWTQYRKA